jgi:hypothetical protein
VFRPVFAGRRKRLGFIEIFLAVLEKTSHYFPMKLTRKTNTVWQGYRFDGVLITVSGLPNARCVWQVNHDITSDRKHDWFETKGEAIKFAAKSAKPCRNHEDIYVVGYSRDRATRGMDGKLLGHKNA